MALLEIENLAVRFGSGKHWFSAVKGISLSVEAGEVVAIVGESGSGKSVTMMSIMGLYEAGQADIKADKMFFDGHSLLALTPKQRRQIIGKDIAMIFQDPMTSLNPSYTVGYQIKEVLKIHQGLRGDALHRRAVELMDLVEIPAAATRLNAYPHQFSGGMSQRVMIAMALACSPKLLIADEPTTALDVTIQAQIMDLLVRLQKEQNMALVMITHDLAVAAEIAQRVIVMYAGQIVEQNVVPDIFERPQHPYTQNLLRAIPDIPEMPDFTSLDALQELQSGALASQSSSQPFAQEPAV